MGSKSRLSCEVRLLQSILPLLSKISASKSSQFNRNLNLDFNWGQKSLSQIVAQQTFKAEIESFQQEFLKSGVLCEDENVCHTDFAYVQEFLLTFSIGIWAIESFVWEGKISAWRFLSYSSWSCVSLFDEIASVGICAIWIFVWGQQFFATQISCNFNFHEHFQ